jgi:hypothetical protein
VPAPDLVGEFHDPVDGTTRAVHVEQDAGDGITGKGGAEALREPGETQQTKRFAEFIRALYGDAVEAGLLERPLRHAPAKPKQ